MHTADLNVIGLPTRQPCICQQW